MSGVPAEIEQAVERFMKSNGIAHVGDYTVRKGGTGGDLTICIPDTCRRNFDVERGDDLDVYADYDANVLVISTSSSEVAVDD